MFIRIHFINRHGKTKAVHVKCYYAPVSVEARLLEWRKRAASSGTSAGNVSAATPNQEAKIVYSTMGDEEAQVEGRENKAETDQTDFLLGIADVPAGDDE
jgi:hypothetical protein